ncbi:hypothetical protein JKP88DRAFT_267368 [Tribonema minus]|uniref:Uncharacterized protein n=1 Tax=Tribonema minus TaxID=303371 RepID=A0A835ZDE7_9STRA|nr:hypothetical protein JKP88DRAFT_267368 [Tribonema minus]
MGVVALCGPLTTCRESAYQEEPRPKLPGEEQENPLSPTSLFKHRPPGQQQARPLAEDPLAGELTPALVQFGTLMRELAQAQQICMMGLHQTFIEPMETYSHDAMASLTASRKCAASAAEAHSSALRKLLQDKLKARSAGVEDIIDQRTADLAVSQADAETARFAYSKALSTARDTQSTSIRRTHTLDTAMAFAIHPTLHVPVAPACAWQFLTVTDCLLATVGSLGSFYKQCADMVESYGPHKRQLQTQQAQRLQTVYTPRRSASCVREGYLFKRSSGKVLQNWQRRWFVLDGTRLCYLRPNATSALRGALSMSDKEEREAAVDNDVEGGVVEAAVDIDVEGGVVGTSLQVLLQSMHHVWQVLVDAKLKKYVCMYQCAQRGAEHERQGGKRPLIMMSKEASLVSMILQVVTSRHPFEEGIMLEAAVDIDVEGGVVGGDGSSFARVLVCDVLLSTVRDVSNNTNGNDPPYCFEIHSANRRSYMLQAEGPHELAAWTAAIRKCISDQLCGQDHKDGDNSSPLNSDRGSTRAPSPMLVRATSGMGSGNRSAAAVTVATLNTTCADCGAAGPDWVSLNLGVVVCIGCSGIHRSLGSHISKVRSLALDALTETDLCVALHVGNEKANQLWEDTVQTVPQGQVPLCRCLGSRHLLSSLVAEHNCSGWSAAMSTQRLSTVRPHQKSRGLLSWRQQSLMMCWGHSRPLCMAQTLTSRQDPSSGHRYTGTHRRMIINDSLNKCAIQVTTLAVIAAHLIRVGVAPAALAEVADVTYGTGIKQWTPLHSAAAVGALDVCSTLVLNGADLTAHDVDQCTPLDVAVFNAMLPIVEFLSSKME